MKSPMSNQDKAHLRSKIQSKILGYLRHNSYLSIDQFA